MAKPFLKPNNPKLTRISKVIPKQKVKSLATRNIINKLLNNKLPFMVGLAAPQIGILKRIILVQIEKGILTPYINPEIIWESKRKGEWYEGCFSTSKICGIVKRPISIKIEATKDGKKVLEKHTGYKARIFQHEIDHLNGVRFPEKISDPKKLHWVLKKDFPVYRKGGWKKWPKLCSFEKWNQIKGRLNEIS